MDNIQAFKEQIRIALKFESYAHREAFDKIPEAIFKQILDVNFNNDLDLARDILTNNLDQIDRSDLYQSIENIKNYKESINLLSDFIESDKKIILVTDTDNDGSAAQAITQIFKKEYQKIEEKEANIDVIYAQHYEENPARGLTVNVVDHWIQKNNIDITQEFLVVTADNGISSKQEQEAILNKYENAKILITDHHIPNEKYAVYDSERSLVFDPMIEPQGYFKERNISGAMVWGELLKGVKENIDLDFSDKIMEDIDTISWYSNMLDYVTSDIRLKPLKEYQISKYNEIGTLSNINNSLKQVFEGEVSDQDVDLLSDILGQERTEKTKQLFAKIRQQNIVAYNLLQLTKTAKERAAIQDVNFDNDFMVAMTTTKSVYDDFDFNYVSQLRPLLLELSVNEDKTDYETRLQTQMLNVFKDLKYLEKQVLTLVREVELMDNIGEEYISFMSPKNDNVAKVFNRKLLKKAYNVANNGFLMFISTNNEKVISGSFASEYNISSILQNKKDIENKLGIDIEILGHEKVAGFYIYPKEDKLQPDVLEQLSSYMNESIETINNKRKQDPKEYIETDFETLGLFNQINSLVRANVGQVESVPVLIKINADDYVNDNKTAKTKNIEDALEENPYGYFIVPLNFQKDAVLLPHGIAAESKKNNYESYLYTQYIDAGAFMIGGIAKFVNPDNVQVIKTAHQDKEVLHSFFKDYYLKNSDPASSENYSVALTNKELKNIPYYKYNAYGNTDFRNVEASIINTIENTKSDIFSVCDVEATGLGQSPKLINIGFLNLKIDQDSGFVISDEDHDQFILNTLNRKQYYVENEELEKFKKLSKKGYKQLSVEQKKDVLFDKNGIMYYSEEKRDVNRVFNTKQLDDGSYVLNRQLIGDSIAMLINNEDTKIAPDLAKLTHIDNWLVEELGIDSKTADKILLEKFADSKVIFETHNGISYDGNVIMSNLPEFSKYYGNNLQIDSIIFSKDYQLAYDDVNVASVKVRELNNIFFYCDEYADYSLKNMLNSKENTIYPDYSDRYLLETEGENIYLIDKKINETQLLSIKKETLAKEINLAVEANRLKLVYDNSASDIMDHLIISDARFEECEGIVSVEPVKKNYRKYSVVKLGEQQAVRNMLLETLPEIKYTEAPSTFSDEQKEVWNYYVGYYHFDRSIESNLNNFQNALRKQKNSTAAKIFSNNKEAFMIQTEAFIQDNKEIHNRFKESWLVKRILDSYEPDKDKPLSQDRIELTAWKTAIPKEKIEEYLDLVLDFKKKYNLEDFYTEEKHNNIVHKIEGTSYEKEKDLGLGDVIQEAHVALNQLSNRAENNYDISIPITETILRRTCEESTVKVLKSPLKTTQMNSYSRAQAETYRNSVYSERILSNVDPYENKIKLKFLPPDTAIFFENKQGSSNSENVLKLVEDISFISKLSIMRNSSFKGNLEVVNIEPNYGKDNPYYDSTIKTPLDMVIKANIDDYLEKVEEVYENNGDYYYSRADDQRKKVFTEIGNLSRSSTYTHKNLRLEYVEKGDRTMYENYIDSVANYMSHQLEADEAKVAEFRDKAENFLKSVVDSGVNIAQSVESFGNRNDYKVLSLPVSKKDVAKFVNSECSEVYGNLLNVCVELSLDDKYTYEQKMKHKAKKAKP